MSKILDRNSVEATKSELDLFTLPPTQVVIEKTRWKEVQLSNPCTNEGPYVFHISPDPQMLHMGKNYLFAEMRITQNGVALTAEDVVAPINLIGKTFISKIQLQLNGVDVYDSGDKYAYKSFLETELNYGQDAKESHLTAALYHKDTDDSATNSGFKIRREKFASGGWIQLMAPIHCDFFASDRLLLNNVDVRVTLHRNSDLFSLKAITEGDYKLEIQTLKWYVKAVDIRKDVAMGIEAALQVNTAKYPVRRVEVKSFHVGEGRRETPENTMFNGQVPRRIIVCCVDGDAYHGSLAKSPFNFQHYNITEISVSAAGETYPHKSLTMDFENNRYVRAFLQLFEGQGIGVEDKGNGITLDSFKNGSCIFAFDLSPDEDDGSHWDLVKEGATSINIQFAKAAPRHGIEVIVYAEFDNLVTIDRNRNTFTDYRI